MLRLTGGAAVLGRKAPNTHLFMPVVELVTHPARRNLSAPIDVRKGTHKGLKTNVEKMAFPDWLSPAGDVTAVRRLLQSGDLSVDHVLYGVSENHELHGANLDSILDGLGVCVLSLAARYGHAPLVRMLLLAGAAVDSPGLRRSSNGVVPTPSGADGVEADISQQPGKLTSGLNLGAPAAHKEPCFYWLFPGPSDVTPPRMHTDETRTPLMNAVSHGNEECARLLIEAGAAVNVYAGACQTPLGLAIENGHVNCVRLLLDAGAKMDANTSAFLSDNVGDEQQMEFVRRGCVDDEKADGRTAEHCAVAISDTVTNRATDSITDNVNSASHSSTELSDERLEVEAKIDTGNAKPKTQGQATSGGTPKDTTEHACDGKTCSTKDKNPVAEIDDATRCLGDTAVFVTSAGGHVACLEVLLQCGARVNPVNRVGETPLLAAVRAGHVDCVRVLTGEKGVCVCVCVSVHVCSCVLSHK